MSILNSYNIGALGEAESAKYLKKHGYRIVTMNFKTRFGEIDIVATKGKEIIFVEVKTRSASSYGQPLEFVNREKLDRISRTLEYFMRYYKVTLKPRIDVIEVYANLFENKYRIDRIIHHKSVFLE